MSDASQYLYKIQPTRPEMLSEGSTDEESEIIAQHYNYLKNLLDEGVLVMAGRTLNTDSSSFGIIILNADSEQVAKQLMDNDPAVKSSVMKAQLFPYRVALMSGAE